MKTLLLMRHAKSGWSDPTLSDHQRPLNERGIRDSPRMARFLAECGLVPDAVLSSTATRAATTAASVAETLEIPDVPRFFDRLYHAPPSAIAEVVASESGEAERVLVVCHNPGIEELVEQLGGRHERMSTAAIAHFQVDLDDWSGFEPRSEAELMAVHRPKELDDLAE